MRVWEEQSAQTQPCLSLSVKETIPRHLGFERERKRSKCLGYCKKSRGKYSMLKGTGLFDIDQVESEARWATYMRGEIVILEESLSHNGGRRL